MVFHTLTRVPQNFKEGVDWLIALKGTDPKSTMRDLGVAIHRLLAFYPVGPTMLPTLEPIKRISQEFLEQPELKEQPFVKILLERFNKPLSRTPGKPIEHFTHSTEADYQNVVQTKGVTSRDVVSNVTQFVYGFEKFLETIKNPDSYNSAYSSKATWDRSCAENPKGCAVILVGIAPMLYAGVRSLLNASKGACELPAPNAEERLGEVLRALGYAEPECRTEVGVLNVHIALDDFNNHLLTVLYDLAGYWAFY
ncbi:hypothetical protein, conserved [Babesia ovata]|uniref:Uncharacterized protein n=1 Tax=Babesia ovata TaxID=189622 RepID=A0A2H6KDG6_9APIC|nr:uncharacterized protein BOVATA_025280 [Babesia ovata]GBE61035.1 hypothetical protein, conserved [Babesia ovata]